MKQAYRSTRFCTVTELGRTIYNRTDRFGNVIIRGENMRILDQLVLFCG